MTSETEAHADVICNTLIIQGYIERDGNGGVRITTSGLEAVTALSLLMEPTAILLVATQRIQDVLMGELHDDERPA